MRVQAVEGAWTREELREHRIFSVPGAADDHYTLRFDPNAASLAMTQAWM